MRIKRKIITSLIAVLGLFLALYPSVADAQRKSSSQKTSINAIDEKKRPSPAKAIFAVVVLSAGALALGFKNSKRLSAK